MAKWNVYATDGLVERLRVVEPDVNLSALFQQALHARLAELDGTADEYARARAELRRAQLALRRLDRVLQTETGRG